MATTYVWRVEQLWVKQSLAGQSNVVVRAQWRCDGTDGNYIGAAFGTVDITQDQGAGYVPYNQLTEAQILTWVWQNGVNKQQVEAGIAQQVTEQLSPAVLSPPLPWK